MTPKALPSTRDGDALNREPAPIEADKSPMTDAQTTELVKRLSILERALGINKHLNDAKLVEEAIASLESQARELETLAEHHADAIAEANSFQRELATAQEQARVMEGYDRACRKSFVDELATANGEIERLKLDVRKQVDEIMSRGGVINELQAQLTTLTAAPSEEEFEIGAARSANAYADWQNGGFPTKGMHTTIARALLNAFVDGRKA